MEKIVSHPILGHDSTQDHNKIVQQIRISQFFKAFKILSIIFLSSYFFGAIFYILQDIYSYIHQDNTKFDDYYELDRKSHKEKSIIITYFAFTSLATVGLGDFVPRSDLERISITVGLFSGVILFSIVMDCFNRILAQIKVIDREFD
jgi:magnesium-transporting ATPase (P-type)